MNTMLTNASDHNRKSSSDRFIPHRANAHFDISYYYIKKEGEKPPNDPFFDTETDRFMNTAQHVYNMQRYRSELWKAMMPNKHRVLTFSSPKKVDKRNKYGKPGVNIWPVIPRSKPLMEAPSLILDMPDLDTNTCHHVVDWGKSGYIGTIYEREVHLWHPEQKLKRHITKTSGRVQHCIKWNKNGTQLAMALNLSSVGVWDCGSCKMSKIVRCNCSFFSCIVTAIEWTRENYLVTGCSDGRLCLWSSNLQCIKAFNLAHAGDIINIKISCNGSHLVTTGIDQVVRLWNWPNLSEDFEFSTTRLPVKSVAWHPWKDSLMVIGGHKYTTLWNVQTRKRIDFNYHMHRDSLVDDLTFNPLSGELVVSYYSYGNNNECGVQSLTVLKDLNTIVDEVHFHMGRVPYLLWDGQGTKLATASSDENLCIWDFFGKSSDAEKKYLRLSNKNDLSMDMFRTLNAFNSCIR